MDNAEVFTAEKAHELSVHALVLYHAGLITPEQLGDYIDKIDAKTEEG